MSSSNLPKWLERPLEAASGLEDVDCTSEAKRLRVLVWAAAPVVIVIVIVIAIVTVTVSVIVIVMRV